MNNGESDRAGNPSGRHFNIAQDVAGGIFVILIGAFFVWQSSDLPMGSLRVVGPGMLPRAVAAMLIVGGLILLAKGLKGGTLRLPGFSWRSMFFIIGGILVFGLLIRTIGLLVAGPAAMIVSSYASTETRFKETAIFSVVMTAFCIFLFKYLLNLPIPVIVNYW
ncbi:MAG: tripartite tricarboxylate transporter TctB family protein [Beijerinckiaceae bacterium]